MRPFVMSIAGFDPSGGAGIIADAKTFESLAVQGLCVCSSITFQRDDFLESVDWISADKIIRQADILFDKFDVEYCKIGLVENFDTLKTIIDYLFDRGIKIILDPILKSSSGFDFHEEVSPLIPLLEKVYLLTPNFKEMKIIFNNNIKSELTKNVLEKTNIFLKGGHHPKRLGTDYLFTKDYALPFAPKKGDYYEKHGSGCILSAAITAYLAAGNDLKSACFKGKKYTANALTSNETLLAYHNIKT
jgi:hydroxymethylpyrimidine/phosphomethylpyrimidine kinase